MTPIEDWSEAQLRRLYREVMEKGDPFAASPHASKSQEELVLEMDAADEVMTEMSLAIDRGVVYRKALYALLPVFFVAGVVVGKLWR